MAFKRGSVRRALTLVELLLVYVLLGVVLALMVGLSDYAQRESKRRLAEDMVLTLREAMIGYHNAVGQYPRGRPDGDAQYAIATMLRRRESALVLQSWPDTMPGKEPAAALFLDPWGRAFRYVTRASAGPEQLERLVMDGNVPIFESAGPDGDFGDNDPAAQDDNVASDIAMIISRGE